MLRIEVDRDSPTAVYRQVASVLIEMVRNGELSPGDRLPAVDDLVEAAGIAILTARKALRVVRDEGYATLSPGMGYYVPDKLPSG